MRAVYLARGAAFVSIGILLLGLLTRLLMPKYADSMVEGGFVGEYYREPDKSFDVLFIGDCEVYESYSTVQLWQEYGINSYIRGSAQQTVWQSYYLLEDTMRYHTPDVVVYNIQALVYDSPVSEAYNRMTLDGMKWSGSKIDAVRSSLTDEESFISYVFPIIRFHTRWSELTAGDVRYIPGTPDVTISGYYMRTGVQPAGDIPEGRPLYDYSFGENAMRYLDMMRMLCEDNGIRLILVKSPTLYPYWYDEYDEQIRAYAGEYGLDYYNLIELGDEAGIDYSTDTVDGGAHMNISGAEKLAHYIGGILAAAGVTDRRGDPALLTIWDEKTERYEAELARQNAINGTGYERRMP